MPAYSLGVLVVLGSVAVALGMMLVVRSRVDLLELEAHNDVAGFVYNTLGIMYGVLVAFVVVIVWGQFQDARRYTELEANALLDLAYLADAFPEPATVEFRDSILTYLGSVAAKEWPALEQGASIPLEGTEEMQLLRRQYLQFEPQTERAKAAYAESLDRLSAASDARRGRVYESTNEVPPLVWAVMLIGALFTTTFQFFFGVRSARSQAVMTIALTAMSASLLYLVFSLDMPFRGDTRLPPTPFERAITTVEQLKQR